MKGFAVQDTIAPDRLVYGLPGGEHRDAAKRLLDEVYATALSKDTPLVETDFATAELVKVSANAFLATKISFINAMAEIAEVADADVTALADAIGYDPRIGRRFLNAGIGFGGGCLPKDIRAFTARAEELGRGESVAFLKEIDAINMRRRQRMVDIVSEALGGQVYRKKVAVLGLAFKPDSDDVRDSPALDVAVQLNGLGAHVIATDPKAIPNSIRLQPQLGFATDTADALHGADVVVLVTEWKEYRELDPVATGELVRSKIDHRRPQRARSRRMARGGLDLPRDGTPLALRGLGDGGPLDRRHLPQARERRMEVVERRELRDRRLVAVERAAVPDAAGERRAGRGERLVVGVDAVTDRGETALRRYGVRLSGRRAPSCSRRGSSRGSAPSGSRRRRAAGPSRRGRTRRGSAHRAARPTAG